MMNRNILFYKLIKSGLHGKVINTLRDLYMKTYFRVKHKGKLSSRILQEIGVNQGGNASPTIFRKYMADLDSYLSRHTGICISDEEILMHLLWADDLAMAATITSDSQKQLDGLSTFCSKNRSIVHEIKTKVMVIGNYIELNLHFNNQPLGQVVEYKYVGNFISSINRPLGDIFNKNYSYLCNKARQAVYSLQRKTRDIGPLPPKCMFHMFESLIQPILTYGSDIWGVNATGRECVDKVLLWYLRLVLGVKATTSSVITLGECGIIPPGVICKVNAILYVERLKGLPESSIVKTVFKEQQRLHELGFRTWYGKVCDLARSYGINLESHNTKKFVKTTLLNSFKETWQSELQDINKNPILRTYNMLKWEYKPEPYMYLVKSQKYRNALTKIRASSHILEIERGRYTRPKTPISERLCPQCQVVDDEHHFLTSCKSIADERSVLYTKISACHNGFMSMDEQEKFIFLLSNNDAQILTWTGKFIYNGFQKRFLTISSSNAS